MGEEVFHLGQYFGGSGIGDEQRVIDVGDALNGRGEQRRGASR
jgi:hypothetical protein